MESPGKLDSETRGCVGSVAVIGAGVSGLTAAYKLKAKGLKVTVFEAEDRAGGKIRSSSQDGFLWDEGANTMTETEKEVTTLIDDLGLREKQQIPLSQNKRYIAKNGFPEMVPSNPLALIKSNFLSTKTKFQVLLEPFMWRKPLAKVSDAYCTESVGQFFQRHFGKEVVDLLIDPFVAGTSGGDPDSLSMRHAFPEIWNLEKKFGSIILGAMRSKSSGKSTENDKADLRRPRRQRGSFSFLGGMQILTDTLCLKLGAEDVKLHSEVLSLSCQSDGYSQTHPWSVSYTDHGEDHSSDFFDAVIMTAPLRNVQEMKFRKGGIPFQLNFLPKVNYLPLSVLITAFKKENIEKPLEGFGVLIPSQEQKNGLRTLGTLFSSMMFPDRAPGDQYLYTTFIGGSRNKDLAGASLDELRQITLSDLRKLIGAKGQPTFMKHVYWENAFPLYSHDYDSVLEGIGRMEENLPGFFYAGNHRDGLSVGKAIVSGCRAADQVLSYICGVKQDS